MTERFTSSEARQTSLRNVLNFFKGVIKGEMVLVPVRKDTYATEVEPLDAVSSDSSMPEFVVHRALLGDPVTPEKAASYGKVGVEPGDPAARWSGPIMQHLAG